MCAVTDLFAKVVNARNIAYVHACMQKSVIFIVVPRLFIFYQTELKYKKKDAQKIRQAGEKKTLPPPPPPFVRWLCMTR